MSSARTVDEPLPRSPVAGCTLAVRFATPRSAVSTGVPTFVARPLTVVLSTVSTAVTDVSTLPTRSSTLFVTLVSSPLRLRPTTPSTEPRRSETAPVSANFAEPLLIAERGASSSSPTRFSHPSSVRVCSWTSASRRVASTAVRTLFSVALTWAVMAVVIPRTIAAPMAPSSNEVFAGRSLMSGRVGSEASSCLRSITTWPVLRFTETPVPLPTDPVGSSAVRFGSVTSTVAVARSTPAFSPLR